MLVRGLLLIELLRQRWCEGGTLARFPAYLFCLTNRITVCIIVSALPFSLARGDDQKCSHRVVQNFPTTETPIGRA